MIRTITIKGFKSIYDETIELGRLNVLIGANGAGKSAALEAIGVLGAAADGRVDDSSLAWRGVRPGVPDLYKSAFADERVPRLIALRAESRSGARYIVSLDNPIGRTGSAWRFSSESVSFGARKLITRSPRGANLWSPKKQRRPFTPGDPAGGVARTISPFGAPPHEVRVLMESLRNFAIYDPQTPVLRGTEQDVLQRDPVGIHGGRLAGAVEEIRRGGGIGRVSRTKLFEMLDWASDIAVASPTPDLISPSIPVATEIVRFTDRHMKTNRNMLSAYDASEGALYVLLALTLLFHPRTPRFFAIENVDHSLHPRLARTLVAMLGRHTLTADRQLLLTTHNPLVLDALDLKDDDVRLFMVDRGRGGHTRLRRLKYTEALKAAQQSGLTLSQMWTRGLLGAVPNLS